MMTILVVGLFVVLFLVLTHVPFDPPSMPPTVEEIEQARAGDRSGAVRRYMERSGGGLRECKRALDDARKGTVFVAGPWVPLGPDLSYRLEEARGRDKRFLLLDFTVRNDPDITKVVWRVSPRDESGPVVEHNHGWLQVRGRPRKWWQIVLEGLEGREEAALAVEAEVSRGADVEVVRDTYELAGFMEVGPSSHLTYAKPR